MDGPTGITIAIIGAAGAVLAALVTGIAQGIARYREMKFQLETKRLELDSKQLQLEQATNEIHFQREALDVTAFINDWSGMLQELAALMADTKIDRFLILRAWNGHLEPRWTSAIYQLHENPKKLTSYIHVELDEDYINRLRRMMAAGPVVFTTEGVEEAALIRGIYETEGVKEAMWAHIETLGIPGTLTKAITYCSFATSEPGGLDVVARTRANLIVGRLKGLASGFTTGVHNHV